MSRACRQGRPSDRLSGRRPRVLTRDATNPRPDYRSTTGGSRKPLEYWGLQWSMPVDNHPAPSISGRQLPAPVGLPDESSLRGPATAPGDRGAQLARLGDRIAELSARIQAATHELLVLIREFDEQDGWHGCLSCAQWLSWRAGLSPGAAREHVRVARALGTLRKLSDAMRRGRVSYSKVRAVTRVATPENEQTLLDVALAGTAAHVERIARAWRRIDRNVEQAEERRRDASRELRTWVDEDGMVVVRGRLTPEVGAVLRRALEAACDQARRVPKSDGGAGEEAADALAGVEEDATDAASDAEEPTLGQRQPDAIGTLAEAALAGGLDRGTAGDRYHVVLHVDTEALAEPQDVPAGTSAGAASGSELQAGGDRVPAGTPATTRVASSSPGDGSWIPTRMPGLARRVRQRRWSRASHPCPGPRPTTPASDPAASEPATSAARAQRSGFAPRAQRCAVPAAAGRPPAVEPPPAPAWTGRRCSPRTMAPLRQASRSTPTRRRRPGESSGSTLTT